MPRASNRQEHHHQPYYGFLSFIPTILQWIFKQEAVVVFLLIQTAMLGYFTWYIIDKALPSHFSNVQKGYHQITDQHYQEVIATTETMQKQHDRIIASLEKARSDDRAIFREMLNEMRGTRTTVEEAVAPIKEVTRNHDDH